jgi:peroxisomal membrane protein 4
LESLTLTLTLKSTPNLDRHVTWHDDVMPSTQPSTFLGHLGDEVSAIVVALVGGARYGIKVRLPHALVMTLMFRRELSSREKVRSIVKVVLEHASSLAAFATVYKTVLAALKWSSRCLRRLRPGSERSLGRRFLTLLVDGPPPPAGTPQLPASVAGYPETPYHALVAGAAGGYLIWGRSSSVNHQIVLYLTSRVIVGLAKRGWERVRGTPHDHPTTLLQHPKTYPVLAAIVWGLVMVLFEESPHVLHRSLRSSMDEIYRYQLSKISSSDDGGVDTDGSAPTTLGHATV